MERGAKIAIKAKGGSDDGESLLDKLVRHMPDVAIKALDRRVRPLCRIQSAPGTIWSIEQWKVV